MDFLLPYPPMKPSPPVKTKFKNKPSKLSLRDKLKATNSTKGSKADELQRGSTHYPQADLFYPKKALYSSLISSDTSDHEDNPLSDSTFLHGSQICLPKAESTRLESGVTSSDDVTNRASFFSCRSQLSPLSSDSEEEEGICEDSIICVSDDESVILPKANQNANIVIPESSGSDSTDRKLEIFKHNTKNRNETIILESSSDDESVVIRRHFVGKIVLSKLNHLSRNRQDQFRNIVIHTSSSCSENSDDVIDSSLQQADTNHTPSTKPFDRKKLHPISRKVIPESSDEEDGSEESQEISPRALAAEKLSETKVHEIQRWIDCNDVAALESTDIETEFKKLSTAAAISPQKQEEDGSSTDDSFDEFIRRDRNPLRRKKSKSFFVVESSSGSSISVSNLINKLVDEAPKPVKKPIDDNSKPAAKKPVDNTPRLWKEPVYSSLRPGKEPVDDTHRPGKKPVDDTPRPGKKPVEDTPKPGKEPVNDTPKSGKEPVDDTPMPGQKLVEDTPKPGKKPVDDPPRTGKKPVDDPPRTGKKPVDDTPKPGKKPVDDTPRPGKKPVDETPKPGEKPVDTPKPGRKPVDDTSKPGKKLVYDTLRPGRKPVDDTLRPGKKAVDDTPKPIQKPVDGTSKPRKRPEDSNPRPFKKPIEDFKTPVETPRTPKQGKVEELKKTGTPYSPIRTFLTSLSGPPKDPTLRSHPEASIYYKNYKSKKEELARRLFKLYNREVFDSRLPDDMLIEWNARMVSTAGYCSCKLVRKPDGTTRTARIVLATKILDSADRLRDTLIHELCHAAVWLLNNISGGHGPFWKAWANKAERRFPELPAITRCHEYKIETKFTYRCTDCGYSFGRHSKSINLETQRCGHCYGTFEVLVNKQGKRNANTPATPATPKPPTGFALFVKENYGSVKKEHSEKKHGDIMKLLGQKFAEIKIGQGSS